MNIFEYKKESSIPRGDVIKGLEVISRNYDSDMTSANQRADNAEHRARQAEKRAEYAESKHKNAYKGNKHSNSEDPVIALVSKIAVEVVSVAGTALFEIVKNRMSKSKSKSKSKN